MTDFSQLKNLNANSGATYDLDLVDITGCPSITLKFVETTIQYRNIIVSKGRKLERMISSKNPDVRKKAMDDLRDLDREVYPGLIVIGWNGIKDSGGKEVPFTKSNCTDFLKALPNWLFDLIRAEAGDRRNFIQMEDSAEELGK